MATVDSQHEIAVEVAYALPDRQVVIPLTVPIGTTAIDAINRSGIPEQLPGLDVSDGRIGVFGRLCPPERVLAAGDRVEIYRPLVADPKEVRRRLAAEGRSIGANQRKP